MSGHDDKAQGQFENLKGKAKEGFGGLTGDKQMQGEGQADQVQGKGREAMGDAKNAADNAKDSIKKAFNKDNG